MCDQSIRPGVICHTCERTATKTWPFNPLDVCVRFIRVPVYFRPFQNNLRGWSGQWIYKYLNTFVFCVGVHVFTAAQSTERNIIAIFAILQDCNSIDKPAQIRARRSSVCVISSGWPRARLARCPDPFIGDSGESWRVRATRKCRAIECHFRIGYK